MMVILANEFARRNFVVYLVLAAAEGPYLETVSREVRVIDLKSNRVVKSLPGLVRFLRRERPDVMLSAMWYVNAVAIAARILSRVPMRLVVSERNTFSSSSRHQRHIRTWLVISLRKWAYRRADRVIAVSEGVADELAAHAIISRSSIDVIYNPVVTRGLKAFSMGMLGCRWVRPGKFPVILGVGRLEPQKRFADLIRAFTLLRKTHDARLIILGDGSLRSELESMASHVEFEDEIAMPGFVDNPYVFMRHAKIFVNSSGWEGLPNALIEAMACGTPVVSTNCPSGPDEILEGGKWGRLVPVGDVEALAQAMADTLDDAEHPDVSARASDFSLEKAVNGYLSVLAPDDRQRSAAS